jgi:glutathione S-transferase
MKQHPAPRHRQSGSKAQYERKDEQKKAFRHARRRAAEATGVLAARNRGPVPPIELYQKEGCPYSHAVRSKLTELGLDFVAHSVPDEQPLKHEQLTRAGGRDQVPFLIDHSSGVKLYESAAILSYLDRTYGPAERDRKDWLESFAKRLDHEVRKRAEPVAWRLRSPIIRAQLAQRRAQDVIETLRGTWQYVRHVFGEAIDAARAQAEGARATTDTSEDFDQPTTAGPGYLDAAQNEPAPQPETTPRPDVDSATEVA